MRIVPYEDKIDLEEVSSLSIMIKTVPFENGYAPAFVLISPSDDYEITIEEAACLMDGIEIANTRIDELISLILQGKINGYDDDDDDSLEEFDEDDIG